MTNRTVKLQKIEYDEDGKIKEKKDVWVKKNIPLKKVYREFIKFLEDHPDAYPNDPVMTDIGNWLVFDINDNETYELIEEYA